MTRKPFAPVEAESVERYFPGERASALLVGDFILTHGQEWTSKVIRIGQALRVHGADRQFTYWTHAALVISEDGLLAEAIGQGVTTSAITKYDGSDYHLVRVKASAEDREQMLRFALSCLGHRYGMLANVSLGLSYLTGCTFSFGIAGEYNCSGLVAKAQERGWAIFNRDTANIAPCDLACYFRVWRAPGVRG